MPQHKRENPVALHNIPNPRAEASRVREPMGGALVSSLGVVFTDQLGQVTVGVRVVNMLAVRCVW